jgi:hypothetical protein
MGKIVSSTDIHKPHYAHDREKYVEYHDHRVSDCTLPTFEEYVKASSSGVKVDFRSCTYALKFSFLREHPICGCGNCKNHSEKKIKNRKMRYDKSYIEVDA